MPLLLLLLRPPLPPPLHRQRNLCMGEARKDCHCVREERGNRLEGGGDGEHVVLFHPRQSCSSREQPDCERTPVIQ